MENFFKRKDFLKMISLTPLSFYTKPIDVINESLSNLFLIHSSVNVDYFTKQDELYKSLRQGVNKRIDKFPAIIAVCKNTQGVSEAIKYAINNKLSVAVKSGGHSFEGFSANDNGMVINVSKLNKATWITDDIIDIEPGCLLGDVYDTILPKGKIIPGGSCKTVAIGGLTLGGGYGLLARKYGLTCDSLLEVTMVDGTGKIVTSKNDAELLWACKGGGNGSFGVITSLKFKTYTAPKTMQSFRFRAHNINAERIESILKKWFEIAPTLPPDCFSAFVLNYKSVYILITNVGNQNKKVQNVINILSAITDKTTKTFPELIAQALKVYYAIDDPGYFKNASAGLYKNFGDIANVLKTVIEIVGTTPGMIYQVNTLGGNIVNEQAEQTSAFPHRAFPFFSELQTYWSNAIKEKNMLQKFEAVQNVFASNGINAHYCNYPDINFKNWQNSYYGANYNRLQQVKKRYDPFNLISHPQSIKLPQY